jgi:tryptophanase
MATTVNMAGGQPISLANLKALRELTSKHGIRIIHDMTRVAENAYMIQQLGGRARPEAAWRRSCARSAASPTAPP